MKPKIVQTRLLRTTILLVSFGPALMLRAETTVDFRQDIRPLLSNNCFLCHGPDEADRQADLRLDRPGEVDLEELAARVTSTDPDVMMPPPDSHKRLTGRQIELVQAWIAAGAPYEEHWAFVPPEDVDPPSTFPQQWSEQPIDRFVLARLEKNGWTPRGPADRRTLVRRVTLDLTGLPPTPAEIEDFLSDSSDEAYARLVDRLLTAPQYGEHMARYWLDLVRFADTNGLHHDHFRNMAPYRDWVIRSFNDNLPFNRFIIDQIAGDLADEPTDDQQIASGFNRLHLIIDRGTALPEESFMRNVVDRVTAVGVGFLGLTVQCAVCHDHKYDPLTQREFYQLYAFFNNFDGEPETGFRQGLDFERGLQPPYIELPSPEQQTRLEQINQHIESLKEYIAEKKRIDEADNSRREKASTNPVDAATDSQNTDEASLAAQLQELVSERDELIKSIPAALVMKERAEIRPAHVMIRGVYDQPGERVERNTPAFLPPMQEKEGLKTRMDLAKWLTDPSHPLTARVAVNRFWQQLFGVGLVKTSEDFGAQGQAPSHPKLLDYLTRQFVDSGWNVKELMRTIVFSKTYRQSSYAPREQYLADPQNRLLARGSRYRLDAEVVRDQILAITGLLNPQLYGVSVKPPQPPGLWKIVAMPSSYPYEYQPDEGEAIYRRSIYTFWKRGLPPPQMTILDAPTRESCIARRERTNTPLQALLLMNEQEYFRAAAHYAQTLLDDPPADRTQSGDEQLLRQAYERVTSRDLDPATMSQLLAALEQFRKLYSDDPAAAAALTKSAGARVIDPERQAELAAWTMTVHSLLNLDVTKTRE